MADLIKDIERATDSLPQGGAIFHEDITFTGAEDPVVFALSICSVIVIILHGIGKVKTQPPVPETLIPATLSFATYPFGNWILAGLKTATPEVGFWV